MTTQNMNDIKSLLFESGVTDLLKKTTGSLCLMLFVCGIPFLLMDFWRGTYISGFTLLGMVCAAGFNVFTIKKKDTYYPIVTFVVIFPLFLWFVYEVILTQSVIGILWSFPFLIGFYFTLPERLSWIASIAGVGVTTIASLQAFDFNIAIRVFLSLSIVCFYISLLIHIINKQNSTLENQASQDPLTGLLNRKPLRQKLEAAMKKASDDNVTSSLLCIDIDKFKHINDSYGHHVGDDVLVKLANLLKVFLQVNAAHPLNHLFRIGGEEFLVLLHNHDVIQATQLAELLRETIANETLLPNGKQVTASIGVSEYKLGSTWTQWMNSADYSMYHAKDAGRNRVIAHEQVAA